MNRWKLAAVLMCIAALSACGGNNTKAGIIISAASTTTGANSVTVPINGTEQFAATVTGVSDTQVYWQVCLPAGLTTLLPNTCTTIPGVTQRSGDKVLTGYGTIDQNGFYTAPSTIPSQNNFVILATSPVDINAFATFGVIIDSGIRIQVTPQNGVIEAQDTQQFTATVTGTSNTAVTWEVNGKAGGDPNNGGTITSSGFYTAPPLSTATVTISAVSGADGSTTGTATVTVLNSDPTLASIKPEITGQGSTQQSVYLTGSNLTSNGSVLVNGTSVPYIFVSSSLLRVPVPGSALSSAGTVAIQFALQPIPPALAQLSNAEDLTVIPVKPSIVGVTPQSFSSTGGAATVTVTGGYFSQGTPATTVQFDNGNEGAVSAATSSSSLLQNRQLSVTLPTGALNTPGLYALTVQNPGVAAGQPNSSTVNIAITPSSISSATGPNSSINLGGSTQPSAIAFDQADGLAVVAEEGANAVALVNTTSQTVVQTIPVGNKPTGVAVDDLLPHHLALVVNSGDNTVSVIDLSIATPAVIRTVSLSGFTPSTTYPVSIGINSQTHRAMVANASTNLGTVIDLVNTNTNIDPQCTVAPCPLVTIGGNTTAYSTGANTQVGIDPSLNWAIVTPGGAGVIDIVDLGFGSASSGSGGRAPAVIATLAISTTIQGVAVDPETHTALLTDFNSGTVGTFSMLNNVVQNVTNNGVGLTIPQEAAAAVNPLQNIGIVVNTLGSGTASIVDLGNHVVLQTITNVTTPTGTPSAVAIDPALNEAFVANSGAGTLSVISLGSVTPKPLQILESSPAISFTSSSPLPLTINGTGFNANSTVLLDGTALTGATVVSSREIQTSVPATSLTSARRFAVQVKNADGTISNAEPLTLVQAITVGTSPAGVAVDTNRDAALVTNSGDGTISVVSVAPPTISPQSLGAVGLIGGPLNAHLNPRAIAVNERLGIAVAANYDSNDLSLVDYSEIDLPAPYSIPAAKGCSASATCTGPAGIAFNQDSNAFLVTDTNIGTASSDVSFGAVTAPSLGSQASISSPVTPIAVDQTPGDIAIAPSFDPFDPVNNPNPLLSYAAIASSAQTSVIDFMNIQTDVVVGRTSGVSQPTGVVYDPLNRVFLVSDSLNNDILMVDPLTFIPIAARGGFNPSSIAYDPQTSTIATVNAATGTLSFLDYLCPPATATPSCTSPQVRSSIGLVGSNISPTAPLGPKTVDIDPLMNLAVLVDAENNRVLLIPLPN
jgi:DNA-binding beta-propeller fold protein YncE